MTRGWAARRIDVRRRHRPVKLLGVVAGIFLAIAIYEWASGYEILLPIFFPKAEPDWKDRIQAALLLLGLPVAYLLWHWRDSNVREQIENQRKDINLKEFQETQLRASGALDEKLPAEAREQLQIAALHQLRGFLRGEYGESFRRPAFELLLAGHAAAMERIGHLKTIDELLSEVPASGSRQIANRVEAVATAIEAAKSQLTSVERERLIILRDEARWVFASGFGLNRRRYDWIELPDASGSIPWLLSGCTFVGASLRGARLENADLAGARLECADLSNARLAGANLTEARLEGAALADAQLTGANLRSARLERADMHGACLDGADLSGARLEQANLVRARLEGAKLLAARLDGANLHEASLGNADLTSAWLPDVGLVGAQLDAADLFDARLERADLEGASLEGARLGLARLEGATLVSARLMQADLRGARLEGADLTWARLEGALLARARFDAATILHDNWLSLSESERDAHRQIFIDRGAIRSDL